MMATAMRGAVDSDRKDAWPCADADADAAGGGREDLPFAFFICPNIPLLCVNGYFLPNRLKSLPGKTMAMQTARLQHGEEEMPKYVIERDIPNVGDVTPDQVIAISQKSCSVLNNLGPKIQWLHSYVTQDKIYCVYIAPNEEMVREHARQGGFPANRVSEVKLVIDPTSAES
jgi:hypothetical protein